MAEQAEHPERVRRPPVALVAVDHHGVVPADPLGGHQCGEAGTVDVVAGHLVVQVGVPVDLDRAREVAGLVQQDVLVALYHHQPGRLQVRRQPGRGDQPSGVGELGQPRVVIERDCHAEPPPRLAPGI